jgi:hypothetical protein
MLKEYLRDDGENLIFTGQYLEIYIPEFYFESRLAENYGTSLRVFCLLNARVTNEKGIKSKIEMINLPSLIYIFPSDIEKKELQLIEGEDGSVSTYYIAKFYKGNKLMANSIAQDSSNVELFLSLLTHGKLPLTIPYNQILEIWQKNLTMNGVKLGVPSTVLEVVIKEVYRNKNKPEETYGKMAGKDPSISPYEYIPANIREICARNSTFAALTFEDFDAMLTSSLNIKKYGKEETISPIEKIIKM